MYGKSVVYYFIVNAGCLNQVRTMSFLDNYSHLSDHVPIRLEIEIAGMISKHQNKKRKHYEYPRNVNDVITQCDLWYHGGENELQSFEQLIEYISRLKCEVLDKSVDPELPIELAGLRSEKDEAYLSVTKCPRSDQLYQCTLRNFQLKRQLFRKALTKFNEEKDRIYWRNVSEQKTANPSSFLAVYRFW